MLKEQKSILIVMMNYYIYEPEKDKQIVKLKDVFNEYKCSENYERLYKKERPTYKTFTNSIKEHASYKHFYRARIKIDKIEYNSILIGHILIEPEKKEEKSNDED